MGVWGCGSGGGLPRESHLVSTHHDGRREILRREDGIVRVGYERVMEMSGMVTMHYIPV